MFGILAMQTMNGDKEVVRTFGLQSCQTAVVDCFSIISRLIGKGIHHLWLKHGL